MKHFNITAQVYKTMDSNKQTLLINQEVHSSDKNKAISRFTDYYLPPHYQLVKIFSVEEFDE
jgi:hypothetical protein